MSSVTKRAGRAILQRQPAVSRVGLGLVLAAVLAGATAGRTAEPDPAAVATVATDDDLARKAELMSGDRWQRAVFEFGQWLTTQTIYTPQEVNRIKVDFNDRVMAMSSFELEYLLDDLDVKLAILATPQAQDAKAWLGEYLAAMSDQRRAQELRQVPNRAEMTAAELQREIERISRQRAGLQQRQQSFDQRREVLADKAATNRQQSAAAAAAAQARSRAPAYSPYRGGNAGGSPPFSDVRRSGPSIGVGPFGAFINIGGGF
jgi:hypothetical protein